MINKTENFIYFETNNLSLVFEIKQFYYDDLAYSELINKKYIIQRYFGPKIEIGSLEASSQVVPPRGSTWDYNKDPIISSSFGNGNNSEVSILVLNSDNSYTNRFYFKDAIVINGGVDVKGPHARDIIETLDIVEYDEVSKLELHTYYSICSDSDVFVIKKKLINLSSESINIQRLMSLEFPIVHKDVEITTFDGAWLSERQRNCVKMSAGTYVNQSMAGYSSHKHNPFFRVKDLVDQNIYAFNLIYSGNHKGVIDINPIEHTTVYVGINDFCFDYRLNSNEDFVTPEALLYVSTDLDEVTHQMHNFINNHIVNKNFIKKERPILFNSWEGSAFSINEENLLGMAKISKEVGIELFVIDDGWFKGRNNDHSSLGDWTYDENKFPNGVGDFAKKIKDLGLLFGIWVEPEMISINSDLFREHPEYALMSKDRYPLERRHQLMIDLTNSNVVDYLYECLSNLLEDTKADYIKWDFNRYISDIYSSCGVRAGELMHRFVMGLYDLLERLTTKYPNVLFEGCSSGGGRFDLGIAYYMPQSWGSDNSSSFDRIRISAGTFEGYPVSTFGAHISRDHALGGQTSSLEDRFNLQAFGGFGYEFDIRTFPEHEVNVMKRQVAYFKKHRKLFQFGNFYSILSPFDDDRYSSFEVISDKKDEAILFVSELSINSPKRVWKFKHLDENAIYQIEVRKQYNIKDLTFENMSGKQLMEIGLDLGQLSEITDLKIFPNGIYSRLIYLKKI